MLKLTKWLKGDRIYVNGLGNDGQAFFKPNHDGVKLIVVSGPDRATVEHAVAQTFGLATPFSWDALLEVAKTDFRTAHAKPRLTVVTPESSDAFDADDVFPIETDMHSHPFPESTTIIADHREPAELKQSLSNFTNLIVEEKTLEIGDFSYQGIVTFERKTARDFGISITEDAKRLFHQVQAMADQPGISFLVIEGDVYRKSNLKQANIDGAISYITTLGVIPIRTMSLAHTAYMIAKLGRHQLYGLGYDLGLRGSAPKDDPIDRKAIFFAEGLPGVSNRTAKALLSHFGSMQALANATENELCAVDGIGTKRAAIIAEIFRQDLRGSRYLK